MKKSLENNSKYNEYDTDGDGIVSDDELAHVTEIKKLEHDLRKQRAQRRMATASLVAMGGFTLAMFLSILKELKLYRIFQIYFILVVLVLWVHIWVVVLL